MGQIRYGTVCEKDPAKGMLRVDFEEDDIPSYWMPMVTIAVVKNSFFSLPDVGEQVVCLVDSHCETGVVIGAIYSDTATPKLASDNISSAVFSDGTKISYDRESHVLEVDTVGEITIKTSTDVKIECNNATVKAAIQTTIDTPTAEFTGSLTVKGNFRVNGQSTFIGAVGVQNTLRATGNVFAFNLIGLGTHKHLLGSTPTSTPIP